MKWTTDEIKYLEEHAGDGAEEIAKHLGRTVKSVRKYASRYGVSLRIRAICPRCGEVTYSPLSTRTGFCMHCTYEINSKTAAEEAHEIAREAERIEQIKRERQANYSRVSRLRKKVERLKNEE